MRRQNLDLWRNEGVVVCEFQLEMDDGILENGTSGPSEVSVPNKD